MKSIGLGNYQFDEIRKLINSESLTISMFGLVVKQLMQLVQMVRIGLDEELGDMVDAVAEELQENEVNPELRKGIRATVGPHLSWKDARRHMRVEFTETLMRGQSVLARFERFLASLESLVVHEFDSPDNPLILSLRSAVIFEMPGQLPIV